MNVLVPLWVRDVAAAAAALCLLVPIGLVVADASPGTSQAPSGSTPRSTTSTSPDREAGPPPRPVVVAAVPASSGARLADGPGRTLYTFSSDRWNDSTCNGRCAEVWPPARSLGGKPQAGSGIDAPMIGSMQRRDGSDQITFGGRPLYYYSGDEHAGVASGRGLNSFGGVWSADAHQPVLAPKPSAAR